MIIIKRPSKLYSPLRYPGGKSSLSKYISFLIEKNNINSCLYIEPYAGGAGSALTLLFEEKVDNIVINDFDYNIYAFWWSVINETDAFIDTINSLKLTIDEWYIQKAINKNKNSSIFEIGFSTFYLNRTNRSGVLNAGPIGGINQKGIWKLDARFNKDNLIKKIKAIKQYRERIQIFNLDGISLIEKFQNEHNKFIFVDPPYVIKGSQLYLNHYRSQDHINLSYLLNNPLIQNWILTYDNVPFIQNLYSNKRQENFAIRYCIYKSKIGEELLIFSDNLQIG